MFHLRYNLTERKYEIRIGVRMSGWMSDWLEMVLNRQDKFCIWREIFKNWTRNKEVNF